MHYSYIALEGYNEDAFGHIRGVLQQGTKLYLRLRTLAEDTRVEKTMSKNKEPISTLPKYM